MSKPNSARPRRNVSSKKSNSTALAEAPTVYLKLDSNGKFVDTVATAPVYVFIDHVLMLVDPSGTTFIRPDLPAPIGIATRPRNVVDIGMWKYRRHASDAELLDS